MGARGAPPVGTNRNHTFLKASSGGPSPEVAAVSGLGTLAAAAGRAPRLLRGRMRAAALADTCTPMQRAGGVRKKSTRVKAKGTVARHRQATRAHVFMLRKPRAVSTLLTISSG